MGIIYDSHSNDAINCLAIATQDVIPKPQRVNGGTFAPPLTLWGFEAIEAMDLVQGRNQTESDR
jgi:hypothetical protein